MTEARHFIHSWKTHWSYHLNLLQGARNWLLAQELWILHIVLENAKQPKVARSDIWRIRWV
jgi:hypothetical protein